MKKKMMAWMVGATVLLSGMPSWAAGETFSDISGHWAEKTIEKWKDQGIVNGYDDGTFRPNQKITRAEFGKILAVAFELKDNDALTAYTDVEEDQWYASFLTSAAAYIPVYPLPDGYETNLPYQNREKTMFLPQCNTLRMHAAEALVEIKKDRDGIEAQLPELSEIRDILYHEDENGNGDVDYFNLYVMHQKVPDNVRRMFEYTYLAKEWGIMQGDPDGNFRPYDELSRAEIITVIDRMLDTDGEK